MWQRLRQAWGKRREARELRRHAIPEPLWQLTLARYPFLAARNPADLAELRRLCSLFLARKEFHGAAGFAVTDEVALAVAAQACLPVLRLGLSAYEGFVGIVMHAGEVVAQREFVDDDGIVHAYEETLAGEAMEGGPLMLAWSEVELAADAEAQFDAVYNVVIHEFAHVIAQRADLLGPASHWQPTLEGAWDDFVARLDAGRSSVIDPYGEESLDEFFAVAVEAFFVAPRELRLEQPALYAWLADLFRQDPAAVADAAAKESPA